MTSDLRCPDLLTATDATPPWRHRPRSLRLDRFTGLRHHDSRSRRCRNDAIRRFVPAMKGEVESSPVNWKQDLALEITVCVDSLLRIQVNVRPGNVVRADLHQREVEWAVLRA